MNDVDNVKIMNDEDDVKIMYDKDDEDVKIMHDCEWIKLSITVYCILRELSLFRWDADLWWRDVDLSSPLRALVSPAWPDQIS